MASLKYSKHQNKKNKLGGDAVDNMKTSLQEMDQIVSLTVIVIVVCLERRFGRSLSTLG
jgi:hypothetical protein